MLEELAASAVTHAEEDRRGAKKLRGEIAKLDPELARFYQAIADGAGAAELAKPIEERQALKTGLEKRLSEFERTKAAPKPIEFIREAVAQLLQAAWEHLERAEGHERKALIQECIKRIEVDGGQVSIDYTLAPPTPALGTYWLPEQDSNLQQTG